MTRTTLMTEEKRVCIKSPEWYTYPVGEVVGEIYFDEPYVDDNVCEELLQKANEIYKEKYSDSWVKEPIIEIYWKPISIFSTLDQRLVLTANFSVRKCLDKMLQMMYARRAFDRKAPNSTPKRHMRIFSGQK